MVGLGNLYPADLILPRIAEEVAAVGFRDPSCLTVN